MNLNLSGKTALVCGSSQGIGLASANELASLGATVILLARNEEKLKGILPTLPAANGQTHQYIVADFAHPEQLKETIDRFEGNIHILVNNTGGPPAGPAYTAQVDEFRIAFNQHLVCNHLLVQRFLPGMKEAKYGRIINVISTSVKQPLKGLGVSNTIRGAVANWSKTLATELAPFGITVNNVLPGATQTERLAQIIQNKSAKQNIELPEVEKEMLAEIPAGRFALPEEIAAAVAFLASPAASYINGINLPVDGGRTSSL